MDTLERNCSDDTSARSSQACSALARPAETLAEERLAAMDDKLDDIEQMVRAGLSERPPRSEMHGHLQALRNELAMLSPHLLAHEETFDQPLARAYHSRKQPPPTAWDGGAKACGGLAGRQPGRGSAASVAKEPAADVRRLVLDDFMLLGDDGRPYRGSNKSLVVLPNDAKEVAGDIEPPIRFQTQSAQPQSMPGQSTRSRPASAGVARWRVPPNRPPGQQVAGQLATACDSSAVSGAPRGLRTGARPSSAGRGPA